MNCNECEWMPTCDFWAKYSSLEEYCTPGEWKQFEAIRATMGCDEFEWVEGR